MANIPGYEVPPQMRDLAESSLDQARKAFGSFIAAARRTTDTVQDSAEFARTNAQDMYARGLGYAEQNVQAAFDLAQKLAAARSLSEATQIQAEYVRERFAAMQAQAKEMGGLAQAAMQQGAERAGTAMQQGAEATRKAVEQGQNAAQQMGHEAQQAVEKATH
ncbi:phasin [Methylobacterium sp. NEAU K]|uniref:phasin n=1 Tax=Methylobacterium sp. NEAU K TaxID=3064946 RepID=UPI002735EE5B|nr:phasin [Methylobacterium sp. NEAU K]MDP4003732.1 phasin [Methylobacterium sp. NEAU K]